MKTPLERTKNEGIHLAMTGFVKIAGHVYERELLKVARDPARAQANTLKRILAAQADTLFGQAHGFRSIQSLESYRARVPVQNFETLRPWIERQDTTGEKALNAEPLIMYALTSGTTGKPKLIPIHQKSLDAYNRIQTYALRNLLRRRPKLLKGHILAIVSPAIEGRSPASNIPFGSTSGHIYEGVNPLIKSKYIVPPEVFAIEDADLKYLAILRLALQFRDVTYVTTANPSTLSRLMKLANDHWTSLVSDIERGTFSQLSRLSPELAATYLTRLRADTRRARELRAIQGAVKLRDVWPELQAIGCWTGGSCSIFLDQWKNELPAQAIVQEIGYLSSEFRGTVPSGPGRAGVPTAIEHYFEFTERDAWEAGHADFLGLHQLQDGKQYYVFVTTSTGLYRYDINDIVQVEGFWHRLPRLTFVQKGKGVTNITGEKLYESQVIEAVRRVESRWNLQSSFFLASADEGNAEYRLYYQPDNAHADRVWSMEPMLAADIEAELARLNLEYAAKRKSARLKPLRLRTLNSDAFDAFKAHAVRAGQREGQFKIVALQYQRNLTFDFEAHLHHSEHACIAADNATRSFQ